MRLSYRGGPQRFVCKRREDVLKRTAQLALDNVADHCHRLWWDVLLQRLEFVDIPACHTMWWELVLPHFESALLRYGLGIRHCLVVQIELRWLNAAVWGGMGRMRRNGETDMCCDHSRQQTAAGYMAKTGNLRGTGRGRKGLGYILGLHIG